MGMTNGEPLKTTCPSCHAVFRVRTEQLELRGGKVRCGKCAYVFNAFETLVTPIETVSLMVPPVDNHSAEPAEPEIIQVEAKATISEPTSQIFPIPTDEQIEREAEAINREIAASAHPDLAHEPTVEMVKRPKLEITPELQGKLKDLQHELLRQEQHARWRAAAWSIGTLLAGAALIIQAAYFTRDQIAARYPQTRPVLEAMCAALGCEVRLLANADAIKLEASDLQALPNRPNTILLSATLRNLAAFPQAYPTLELTLTDASNQTVARRHFTPREYLAANAKSNQGMPPGEDVPVRLPLELIGLNAVGYKLFVFYP